MAESGIMLHVTMPDGSVWAVSGELVAEHRASYVVPPKLFEAETKKALADDSMLLKWASREMRWCNLHFIKHVSGPKPPEYSEWWRDAPKQIVRPAAPMEERADD